MSDGLAAVQSRIVQLQALLGITPVGALGGDKSATSSSSSGDFAGTLADALGTTSTGTTTATSGSGSSAPTSGGIGAQAVALAQTYSGVPYLWGGTNPAKGLDCSGLTQLVYGGLGVTLPRVAADQARAGTAVASVAQAQPGDLVFFGSPVEHVGIYIGNGSMIDAPHTGSSVGVHKLYGTPTAIRRVAPATATAQAVSSTTAAQFAASLQASALSSALSSSALDDGSGSASSSDPLSLLTSALGGSSSSGDPLSLLTSALGGSSSSGDPLSMLTASSLPGLSTADQLSAGLPPSTLAALAQSLGAGGTTTAAAAEATRGTVAAGAVATSTLAAEPATIGPASSTTLTGPYAQLFTAAGDKYGVDPALLSAVAEAESSYNASAVSPAGARGLMQLMPGTARSLGVNPNDPAQAVDGAARMLSGLLTQFGGRVDLAVAGYNAGAGAVQRYGGVPPYPETRTYVQRVTSNWEALR